MHTLSAITIFIFCCIMPGIKIPVYPGGTLSHKEIKKNTSVIKHISVLYLTFDDGPDKESNILNAIAVTDSIPINVFLIGRYAFKTDTARKNFKLYQSNPFIEIGNHSFTHANGNYHEYYQDPEKVAADFLMNFDTIHLNKKIARLPGRNCWRIADRRRDDLADGRAVADSLASYGYRIFGWDIEWHIDYAGRVIETAKNMLNKIERIIARKNSFIPGNIVILCHESMLADPHNEWELKLFIKEVKAGGNHLFEHLSNYPRFASINAIPEISSTTTINQLWKSQVP